MNLPELGQRFRDRYMVEQLLGEGAFGAVYAATDELAARKVALKILKPDAGTDAYDPKTKARFDREIKAVANLRSPHTVSMFDCGETEDGLLFVVFEHVPGEDLSSVLRHVGRLSPDATVHIARQVLLSLREAHDAGLLHRDIKPHNIRVFEYQGDPLKVKLLDFGLARGAQSGGPQVTEQGEIIGTPRYMAPEQLMDQQIGPAADVYGVGMVMLEMLLGSDALSGTQFGDQLQRLREDHVFSLGELEHSGLGPIIRRMTAREPEQRYHNAGAALAALDQHLSGAHTAPFPASDPSMTPTNPVAPPPSTQIPTTPAAPPSTETSPTARAAAPPPPSSASRSIPVATETMGSGRLIAIAAILLSLTIVCAVFAYRLLEDEKTVPPPLRPEPPRALVSNPEPPRVPPADTPDDGSPSDDAGGDAGTDDAGRRLDGCGIEPPFEGGGRLRLPGMMNRDSWLTHIPKDYDPEIRHPLVVLLHPTGQSAQELLHYSNFGDVADERGFVVIAPHDPDPIPWQLKERAAIEFIRARVDDTRSQLCLDERRVFVIAQGHGGFVTEELSCEPWVTAIATNAFRLRERDGFCDPASPKPYLLLSPTNGQDPVEGGRNCAGTMKRSVAEVEQMWRKRNGCRGKRRRAFEYRGSVCHEWTCETPFESCLVEGGHNWPGSPRRPFDIVNCDGESPDFPMAERVWDFFSRVDPLTE